MATGTDHNGDRTQTIPGKQALVRDRLMDLLDRLEVGAAIPPERRLAADLGVSRPTLRAVVDELVREGVLHPRHGSGTYVSQPKLGQKLHLSPADEVFAVERLRLADDEPMAFEFLHVPKVLAPELTRRDLEHHSFYDLLRERHGIVVSEGVQTIEPTVANEEEAEILGVPLHAPAFLFERVSTSHRGDRYKLVTELRPARRGT